MILGAFGVIDASPIQVSEALRKLNMSHTFVGGFGRTTHATVDGLCAEQPVWPVIIDRVRNIPKVAIPYDRDRHGINGTVVVYDRLIGLE